MKITDISISSYDVPLKTPITLANQTLTFRQGLILTFTDSSGNVAYGEVSPLPGLHKESLKDVTEQLLSVKDDLVGLADDRGVFEMSIDVSKILPLLYPTVRMGIDMALFNLCLKQMPQFVPQHIETIAVNALLLSDSTESVEQLLNAGFSSIKVKVGQKDITEDVEKVLSIKKILNGRATIRLDANRAWSLEQAIEFSEKVGLEAIEYIEEPTKDPADHRKFFVGAGIPVALDETLLEAYFEHIEIFNHIAAFVLKPSVLGGFSRTALMIDIAKSNNLKPVISSCFETGLSLSSYALFAAAMGAEDTPIGLDTLKYFEHDILGKPFAVENGAVDVQGVLAGICDVRADMLESLND